MLLVVMACVGIMFHVRTVLLKKLYFYASECNAWMCRYLSTWCGDFLTFTGELTYIGVFSSNLVECNQIIYRSSVLKGDPF